MISKSVKDQGQVSIRELLDKNSALEAEVQALKISLEEAEELKRAISEGDLDALIIPGPQGKLIFTLDSADRAYRVLVETMSEGTVTFAGDGIILYCNRRFAELVRMRPQAIVGTSIYGFIESEDEHTFKALLNQRTSAGEINLRAVGEISVPVYLSISSLQSEESQNAWCLVATDLTEQKKNEEIVSAGRLAQSIIKQTTAEAIVVCDMEGKITHFSNAVPRICECDPTFQKFEDIIDLQLSEGEDAGRNIFPVSSALKGETIIGMEAILEVKDCQGFHKKLHFLLNSGPLKNSDGGIIGCVVTLTDITERKQAEKELLESEKRFKLLSEANSTLLLSKDPENMIKTIAEKVMYHLNCDVFFNYVFDEWLDKGSAICGCVALDGYRIVSRDVQHNGDKRADLVRSMGIQAYSCQPLHIGEKTIGTLSFGTKSRKDFRKDELALMSTVADQVSVAIERKRAEEALRESEENYRNIIETANEGIWIVDSEVRTTYVNKKMAEMLGCTQEEMIGKSARIFTDKESTAISKRNMKNREKGINESHELKLTRKDGSSLWTHINAKSLFDKSGKFVGSMSMLTDITDRKEAEDELKETFDNLENLVKDRTVELEKAYDSLKESERGLAEAQKMAHLGNWTRNIMTGEIYWSDEVYRIFGFKPQEFGVTYSTYLSSVHPDDQDRVIRAARQALERKLSNIDYRIVLNNGEKRVVLEEFEVVLDEKSNPVQLRGTTQDITERKKAEEALEKMDKMRIKEIHHRIKNNLQVICSLLSLEAEKFSDEKMLEALKQSQNRVASMALIHEELYKGDKNDNLDFAAYLRKLTADLFSSYSLGNDNISLKMDLEQVYLDMDTAIPLGIIINELISNSLKHAFPAGSRGEIYINLQRTETFTSMPDSSSPDQDLTEIDNFQYLLRVKDDGEGIPEEIEIEDADSLGLQLVNILVDQIDGCIELKRGYGTDFRIRFGSKEP